MGGIFVTACYAGSIRSSVVSVDLNVKNIGSCMQFTRAWHSFKYNRVTNETLGCTKTVKIFSANNKYSQNIS